MLVQYTPSSNSNEGCVKQKFPECRTLLIIKFLNLTEYILYSNEFNFNKLYVFRLLWSCNYLEDLCVWGIFDLWLGLCYGGVAAPDRSDPCQPRVAVGVAGEKNKMLLDSVYSFQG